MNLVAAILCFLALLSLPWLFLRLMERRSRDQRWLYHKVFKDNGT